MLLEQEKREVDEAKQQARNYQQQSDSLAAHQGQGALPARSRDSSQQERKEPEMVERQKISSSRPYKSPVPVAAYQDDALRKQTDMVMRERDRRRRNLSRWTSPGR